MGNAIRSPEQRSGSNLLAFLSVNIYLGLHYLASSEMALYVGVICEQMKILTAFDQKHGGDV